jgi:dihydrofolate reductase
MKKIVLIAAIQDDHGIGYDEKLLYRIPEDLKRFKQKTLGSSIVMGSKTFLTFKKPLPNRTHYVLSRDLEKRFKGAITVHSLTSAIAKIPNGETVYIIGGGEIYALALPYADAIELTRIKGNKPANVFFPDINKNGFWRTKKGPWKTDPTTKTRFRFELWEPRKPNLKERILMFFGNYA